MVLVELLVRARVQVHVTAHVLLLIHVSEVHTAICDMQKKKSTNTKTAILHQVVFSS